ncbi:hypothetical protein RND71_002663 [Anisodus tanguticus]|uniref:Uncharacterized protein n=1 Tax=Anisodus tanguticus TaxID=243964 RepID=A0AAE1SWE0_9SOLA|nr:hypothetical protein RND71_002663 [Anisodus tanguticus]
MSNDFVCEHVRDNGVDVLQRGPDRYGGTLHKTSKTGRSSRIRAGSGEILPKEIFNCENYDQPIIVNWWDYEFDVVD